MHSIVMPSLAAFLTIFSFIPSPTPCCTFLPLTPLQSPLKKTRYPDATISEVPSLFASCSPMTSQPFAAQGLSRVSMCPIPLTPLTAAVQKLNVPNVSSFSRDLALAALRFLRVDFLSACFLRRFFRASTLRLLLSSRCFLPRFLSSFFQRVGCGTPTTPRLLHRRHFCSFACSLPAPLLFSLGVPRFPGDGAPALLLPQARLPRETKGATWWLPDLICRIGVPGP